MTEDHLRGSVSQTQRWTEVQLQIEEKFLNNVHLRKNCEDEGKRVVKKPPCDCFGH